MESRCNTLLSLEGKRILVTGASSGVGEACAILASHFGAEIILCGRDRSKLRTVLSSLAGVGHSCLDGDLRNEKYIKHISDTVNNIDGVVFSAGIYQVAPFLYTYKEMLSEVFEINYFSQMELLRMLILNQRVNKRSSIVYISSISGNHKTVVGNGAYGSSKAAVNSSVQELALELAESGIRINSICPGTMDTNIVRSHNPEIVAKIKEKHEQSCPLQRFGTPNDIANLTVFLLSNASSWITGQCINVDGGLSIRRYDER